MTQIASSGAENRMVMSAPVTTSSAANSQTNPPYYMLYGDTDGHASKSGIKSSFTVANDAVLSRETYIENNYGNIPEAIRSQILSLQRSSGVISAEAAPITIRECYSAINFLADVWKDDKKVPPPKWITPSVHGAIILYWENGDSKISLHCSGESSYVDFQLIRPGREYEFGNTNRSTLLAIVKSIFP